MQIHAVFIGRAFGIDLHEQIAGRNDPRFVFAENVLPVLAKNFKVFLGEYFGKALIEFRQVGMGLLFGSGQLGSIVGGEDESTPNMTIGRVFG